MSYALDVAPDAEAAFRTLDIEVQEAILDLLDQLAREDTALEPLGQTHLVFISTPAGRAYVYLNLSVVHPKRTLTLTKLNAVVL